jgi:3-oxoacyl-[acyl-carrier protein] reductase
VISKQKVIAARIPFERDCCWSLTSSGRFQGKVALITGWGAGIGKGTALRLAQEGCNVAGVDIKKDSGSAVAEEIRSFGGQALPIAGDASQPEVVKNSVSSTIKKFGKIDILVNNVGLFELKPIMRTEEKDWEKYISINAKTTFLWSHAVANHMIKRQSGCIVNLASDSGKVGDPYSGIYVAAKHAVIGLTKNLALELAPYAIRVNAVCPGFVETNMLSEFIQALAKVEKKSVGKLRKEMIEGIPLRRFAKPSDIASVIAFLCSDDASYMTGQAINITGGLLML